MFPEFSLEPILFIVPITLAPVIEHFGDVVAISTITGKDYLKDPGIHTTMFGDGPGPPWPRAWWADRPAPPTQRSSAP